MLATLASELRVRKSSKTSTFVTSTRVNFLHHYQIVKKKIVDVINSSFRDLNVVLEHYHTNELSAIKYLIQNDALPEPSITDFSRIREKIYARLFISFLFAFAILCFSFFTFPDTDFIPASVFTIFILSASTAFIIPAFFVVKLFSEWYTLTTSRTQTRIGKIFEISRERGKPRIEVQVIDDERLSLIPIFSIPSDVKVGYIGYIYTRGDFLVNFDRVKI